MRQRGVQALVLVLAWSAYLVADDQCGPFSRSLRVHSSTCGSDPVTPTGSGTSASAAPTLIAASGDGVVAAPSAPSHK